MTTVTFDTLQLVGTLKAAGFTPEQAESVVRAISLGGFPVDSRFRASYTMMIPEKNTRVKGRGRTATATMASADVVMPLF